MEYTFESDGRKFKIDVNERGMFGTIIDGVSYTADTYEGLKKKIVYANRREKIRIAVPATMLQPRSRYGSTDDGGTLVDIVITGIHQRNGSILTKRVDNNKAETLDHWHRGLYVRLTEAEKKTYQTLSKSMIDARAAFEAFEKSYVMDKKTVEKKVADAEKAAGLEQEAS